MKNIIITLAVLMLIGCKTRTIIETVNDTVQFETVTIRDRIVEVPVPADSAEMFALMECDSNNQVSMRLIEQLNGENTKLSLALDSIGLLRVKANVDETTVNANVTDTARTKIQTIRLTKTVTVREKDKNWIIMWIGIIAVCFTISVVAIKKKT